MTFYLKYRPQKIQELNLTKVREELGRILGSKDIPHAFLFTGPRGAGKTSAARILAKVVNCERIEHRIQNIEHKGLEPCNECAQCVAITNGSSLDVIEIDAASNRGVDDIRALRDGVRLATAGARKKVYIIDEAHMLTTEASNALLKTLEEPPEHVVFVLATTSSGKLLDTIRSRCTTVNFYKAGEGEIVEALTRVVDGEGLKVEEGVFQEIAQRVDGSFREAHKLLEQISLGKKKVTLEDAQQAFSSSVFSVEALIGFLGSGETKQALMEIEKVSVSGGDLKQYATSIVSCLRGVLLSEFGAGSGELPFTAGDLGGVEKVREGIELFSVAANQISTAVISQLPLELAVIKFTADPESIHLSGNSNPAPGGTETGKPRAARSGDSTSPVSFSGTPDRRSSTHGSAVESGIKPVRDKEPALSESDFPEDEVKKASSLPTEEVMVNGDGGLEEKWKLVMREVKPKNHSIEALLRATRPRSYDGKILTIEVFYKFHKERIEKDPYRSLVEEIAAQILGAPVRLDCMLSESQQKARDIVNISETVEDDIVRVAEDIFGTSVDANKLAN